MYNQFNENPFADRHHLLEMAHKQYLKLDGNLQKTKIGKYYIFELLDSGAFGSVYRAMNDQTKQEVAVKCLNLREVQLQPNPTVKRIKRRLCRTESLYMMKCDSPNLVKCYEVYQNKQLKVMMIEYCNGGNLASQISLKKRIPEDEAIMILKQIINGIAELHSHKIIHRDLKAQNILSHNGDYKIADFGFAKQLTGGDNLALGTCLGTTTTMAPQVYSKKPYNLKADIWSVGVIFFYMIFGEHPFRAQKAEKLQKQAEIMQEKLKIMTEFNGVRPSPKVIKFFQQVLTRDINKRLGWRQLVQHQIFKRDDNDALPLNFRKNVQLNKIQELFQNENKLIYEKQSEYNFSDLSIDDKEEKQKEEQINQDKKKQKVIQINPVQLESKKKQINKLESEKYLWAKQAHLQCLKTELIYEKIILPIQSQNLLDLTHKNREEVQMMYLLCTRCLNNISVVNDQYEKLKNIDSVKSLHEMIKGLHKKIIEIWNKYSKLLTQIQSKVTSMIFDFGKKLWNGQQRKTKDRFLTGWEIIQHTKASRIIGQIDKKNEILSDYTREQQIQYTIKYIELNLKKFKTKGKAAINVRNHLQHYKQINQIALQNLKLKDFKQYIKTMLV